MFFAATIGEMFHSCGCLTASANIESLKERHEGPPWNLVLFPDPVKRYKVLLLWESVEKLQEMLQQTSLLSSQISMACQLSFKTASYIQVPVYSPVEFSRCNVLVIDNEDAVGNRHEVAVEEQQSDYVFRLWAMGDQSSICSQCGIIQNHRGLEWYTKLSGLRLNVGAVHVGGLVQYPRNVSKLKDRFNGPSTARTVKRGREVPQQNFADPVSYPQDVDIALGGLSVFYFRFLFIDFVYPYITDVFAFVSKAPTRIPLTQAIIYPFQQQARDSACLSTNPAFKTHNPALFAQLLPMTAQVWMALFASLLVAWAGVVILRRWTPREKLVGDAPDIWLLLATLIRQSDWGSEFRTLSFRCLLTAWLVLSLVASNSYSCLLLSFMSVPAFSPRVDTSERLQEAILAGKYTAGTSNGTAQYTLIMVIPVLNTEEMIVRLANTDLANTWSTVQRRYGKTSRRLVESGHFLKWEREDQPIRPKVKQSHFEAIELSDVFSHGTILIAGYCMALVALVSEYARFRYVSRRSISEDQRWIADNTPKAIASSMMRPRRTKKALHQRRQGSKRPPTTVVVAVPTPLPPLPPVNRPRRWETRVVGQSGFKRVSINLGPHAFPKIDSAATAGLPLEAGGAGGQARRDDRCPLPNLPPVST
ncbi:hypothetical protein HPB49_019682 [Dermacentor silvarum]|uniref:Uncharacterized protein n=1 Tax=Dermacentor silvarum TaxID=543639 RepID=A0ACB8CMI8_DERSI|nr:hypothetical protein HPB49_019682 [Dermacentor silvarum]